MPKRINLPKKRPRRPTFIKQWREYRGYSQEKLGGMLETSGSMISRIESGETPYTQDVLEGLADALMTDIPSLLMRDPTDPEAIWSIWDQAKEGQRVMIEEVARTILKTGTR
ncbi:helix-turn-helix domain-containing protein [Tardiphaga sp. 841_E9_N1_2]|uniref:helix-turn-helix domain-containing protein n=1 Tax=Tardiphaga sp. 841_E9_N1_2 TaxID=3240762 RepID=UPI003F243A96